MINKAELLIPDATYHIYNRANGKDCLFLSDDNYRFFLENYGVYISPIADTFCYCLMPNHFHFLIRIKSEAELRSFFKDKIKKDLQGFENLEGLLSQQFSNFFNSYVKAFNKQQNRKGSLLMHPYKRKRITDTNYLTTLVHYIHYNPVEANLCKAPTLWQFSSYNSLISSKKTNLKRSEVMSWFEDVENFKYVHNHVPIHYENY